jgi:hypothetical protein
MNLRSLALVPVCALAAAALLWKPADAQTRLPPPGGVVAPPPVAPFTYNQAAYQNFQTQCTVSDVQYWEGKVTAALQCRGGTTPLGQTYPGGVAYVVLPDNNAVTIAVGLRTANTTTGWTAWHNAGDAAYRLQGISN